MSQQLKLFFLCLLLVGMTGCARNPAQPEPNEFSTQLLNKLKYQDITAHEDASLLLAESAANTTKAFQRLALIKRAVHPHAKLPPMPDPVSIGMSGKASIDWAGPIEPLLQKLAKASHYNVRVIGRRPPIPIIISVNAKNTSLADILRDVSFQANQQATIMLYPHKRLMELRYLNK